MHYSGWWIGIGYNHDFLYVDLDFISLRRIVVIRLQGIEHVSLLITVIDNVLTLFQGSGNSFSLDDN